MGASLEDRRVQHDRYAIPAYAFFGVSATGCASNKTTHLYPFVSPWRVEDPLMWLLAELGVIPTKVEVH